MNFVLDHYDKSYLKCLSVLDDFLDDLLAFKNILKVFGMTQSIEMDIGN
jgi:hypothetical protein